MKRYKHTSPTSEERTQRDMLRSTAAMIKNHCPEHGDLAKRLEELSMRIESSETRETGCGQKGEMGQSL